jgi:AcrR family transcriptional regulator
MQKRARTPKRPAAPVVWERAEPEKRSPLRPLSREQIVEAAIAIADKDGLESVSLRNVAAKLRAGPMRLYGYTATKEGLLDLMVDEVYGEIVRQSPVRGNWREALRDIARRRRNAALRHPWFGELLGGRPHLGPHALAHQEAALATLAQSFSNIDLILQALRTVDAYVIGMLRAEASELRAQRETGLDKERWQLASYPYMQKMLETGEFPMLSRVLKDAGQPAFEVSFERGLEWVFDGIAAQLDC